MRKIYQKLKVFLLGMFAATAINITAVWVVIMVRPLAAYIGQLIVAIGFEFS